MLRLRSGDGLMLSQRTSLVHTLGVVLFLAMLLPSVFIHAHTHGNTTEKQHHHSCGVIHDDAEQHKNHEEKGSSSSEESLIILTKRVGECQWCLLYHHEQPQRSIRLWKLSVQVVAFSASKNRWINERVCQVEFRSTYQARAGPLTT
jgi:hypothetical protein